MAFKHCHSSHSIPIVVPARHVLMTQPELYLEAWGMALCSSASQSDRRFPEHLGLGFPPEDEGQKDFPNGLFPSHEGPHLLEALLRGAISVNATILPCCKIQPFYKACKTCYRKARIVGKSQKIGLLVCPWTILTNIHFPRIIPWGCTESTRCCQ